MRPHILVVEDKPGIRRVLMRFCEHKGQHCLHADSADHEWVHKLLSLGEIRLAFVDVNLDPQDPDIPEGLGVIELLVREGGAIFVCAMSGKIENKKPALKAGADIFLQKPFEMKDIFAILDSVFKNEDTDPSA